MNREEAIEELKMFKGHTFNKTEEALDMAIEALEQEPILDKIREEMQKEKENIHFDLNEQKAKWVNSGIYDGLTWAQEIIDKYRKEQ